MNIKRNGFYSFIRTPICWALFALTSLLAVSAVAEEMKLVESYTPRSITAKVERLNTLDTHDIGSRARTVRLGSLDSVQLKSQQASEKTSSVRMAPLKVGVGREIRATSTQGKLEDLWIWELTSSGRYAGALRIASPGAVGTRLALDIEAIDPRTILRFTQTGTDNAISVSGIEVLDVLRLAASESPEGATSTIFMAPYVSGEDVTFEVILPVGQAPEDFKISIPRLSHLFMAPYGDDTSSLEKASGSCNVDVKCRPEWSEVSKGVAKMVYSDVQAGASYTCTGTLLNDAQHTGTPYFLTAEHCISSQTLASTLQTFWFYTSTGCNYGANAYQTRTGGATLLYRSANTDTSLLQLRELPPSGATYQGWATHRFDASTDVGTPHHPNGDLQKITTGRTRGLYSCGPTSCTSSDNGQFLSSRWTSGVTEPGSSGSGLFWRNGTSQYLIGQLLGGGSSCASPFSLDFYGRFDLAYNDGMNQWLDPAPSHDARRAIYRFWHTQNGSHFFTGSVAERNHVINTNPILNYEGIAFYAYPSPGAGMEAVHRFYNGSRGAHFYTISAAERNHVQATLPGYAYEGEAWYARTAQESGSAPLYRFFKPETGTHFYTTSAAERDHIRNTLSNYEYEGVGYYVWSTR